MENKDKTLVAQVHPVAMLIASNHFTRMALLNDGKFVPVVGALLGKQNSRTIEIQNCFEVETKLEGENWVLNETHLEARTQMYQETFPNQVFLGFYTVGDHEHIDNLDQYLYEAAAKKSETIVVLLKMSPLIDPTNEKIPVNVFESAFDSQSGQQTLTPVQVNIISDSAEQISTDHAAKFTSGTDKGETTTSKKLSEHLNAMKMLMKGLSTSMDYLKTVNEGRVEADPEILRELHKLAIKLDFLQKQQISTKSDNYNINDRLIVLLTMNTKLSGSIFSVIGKLNMIINEHNNSPQTPMKRKENF